ncbi:sugar phosphate isomerase/epimerase [Georgenia sp. TF02-10]|uniref:sugar phosphate isomerase/epimerase family protein n=1 Tax=Georgenia sp. TF02-10 TaxID=2917725 RepID=UPI001FA7ADBF|nr:sugar phosphate isomerase/epimerase family protein [Georgenia sp. TF02-10]UNX54168.1 sugar phosphate isomerase/epimerase [Georgenia sp. TF02-10]
MPPAVGLSTSSIYPAGVAETFSVAAELGYDGVEVMVLRDPDSQDIRRLRELMDRYGLPVLAIHAPTLLLTQGVWGNDPWDKVDRSTELATEVGADVVVLHPPFRWQRSYAEHFVGAIAERERLDGMRLAVENMFPWRARTRRRERVMQAYLPGWDPLEHDYASVTLDLSHTATAGLDRAQALAMADELGPRLAHVHLADGTHSYKDEHLVPGRGDQPCAEVLAMLGSQGYTGAVVVEVNTRKLTPDARRAALTASLAFAREHLAAGERERARVPVPRPAPEEG